MIQPETYQSGPNGLIPNSRFLHHIYRGAVPSGGENEVRALFQKNGWSNNWRYPGIYTYGHFHSTTHECLGCASGFMEIRVCGEIGTALRVEAVDVIVMPAGVSHAMTANSDDNLMVGGYVDGREWDNVPDASLTPESRYSAVKLIMSLPIPTRDPVTGGPMDAWINLPSSVDTGWNDFRDGLDAA